MAKTTTYNLSNSQLTISAVSLTGKNARSKAIHVMCGDDGPEITDGGAIWQTISRPLARGLTIFQGYNPVQMTIQARFGIFPMLGDTYGWDTSDTAGQQVESDLDALESFAGSKQARGEPSILKVQSPSSQGGYSALVPPRYASFLWVMTAMPTYENVIRNDNGYRIRADATIKLINYLNFGSVPSIDETKSGVYFVSKPGADTALTIAGSTEADSPQEYQHILAERILKSPKNNPLKASKIKLSHKSKSWHIPHGKSVWIPAHDVA